MKLDPKYIKLYSTGCPKCAVLKMKLDKLKVNYELETNQEVIVETGKKNSILSAPILEVDGAFYDFISAVNYLKQME